MTVTATAAPRRDIRQLILDTALHLFSDNGYFNTSVHDIRREADVSIGSIYHHFGNKEAIATALYHDLLEQMEGVMTEVKQRYRGSHDQCRAVVTALFEMTEQEPRRIGFALTARHREFMPDERPVCSSRPFTMMRDMVAAGIEEGVIAEMEPLTAAACLFGGALRLIQLRLDGVLTTPLPGQLDAVWEASWRGVARQ